ncbi:hypothetical protein GCM10025783_11400 [Amnibacterium soli]|uniref:Uncharacterized protein n=2 Tax=Amnibacterium soli TaxID=1282736 RepID=A0ABP8Z0D9_9MICO
MSPLARTVLLMEQRGARRGRACPVCGAGDPRRIAYGLPAPELFDDPDIALGGCLVADDAPRFRCRTCATDF